jgi:hypothetical protein
VDLLILGQQTPAVTRSIFCFLRSAIRMLQALLPESITSSKPSSAGSHQCGQEPRLSERHPGAQADSITRSTLPLSARSLSEQCRGTRPPRNQTSGKGDAGIPFVSLRLANHSGNRDRKHDTQGADSVASKGRHPRSGCIHLKPIQPCSRSLIVPQGPRTALSISCLQHCRNKADAIDHLLKLLPHRRNNGSLGSKTDVRKRQSSEGETHEKSTALVLGSQKLFSL